MLRIVVDNPSFTGGVGMYNDHRTSISNVLVVGSGGAGLRAAIAAHMAGAEVVVVGKRLKKDAHTVLAAGGDLVIVWLLRNESGDVLVQDHPSRVGCLVIQEDSV